MKRVKAIFATMVLCMGMVATFTSCSDNDDEPATPAAKSVESVYTGPMTCNVMGSESVFENQTLTVTATDDTTVNVTISTFGNPPMQVPQLTITGVKVSGTDGKYSLARTEFSGSTDAGRAYSGTLEGSFADGAIKLDFSLQYGAMPMPMICSFTAPKN